MVKSKKLEGVYLNKLTSLGLALLSTLLISCGANDSKINTDLINNPLSGSEQESKVPKVTFTEQRFEFGTISQGEVLEHVFELTNTGDAPLLISSVYGSCGCTVVDDWAKEPIAPGEKTNFTARFNSESKEGMQTIKITVEANTLPAKSVTVMAGNVVKPNK